MQLQESGEMYLESIYILSQRKPAVRSLDVADYMNFSKPSVSRAVGLLKNGGYITVDRDGYLHLTQEGLDVAQTIYERHIIFSQFLMRLGVDEETATADACRMEHDISAKSFSALKKHIEGLNAAAQN